MKGVILNRTGSANVITWLFVVVMLIGLPLLGVTLGGEATAKYMEFPPLTRYVSHAGFSWPVFGVVAVLILAIVLPFIIRVCRNCKNAEPSPPSCRPFPWWGWMGVIFGIAAWVLAWTRFGWFAQLQCFTFSPLWFAYILVVNALTWKRTGQCMLRDRTGFFVLLFPVSAAFWWFFEYLNRFVQNWYYVGTGDLTPLQYFLFATLPFSTVLPAMLGTYELLLSMPRASACLDRFMNIEIARPRVAARVVLVSSCAGLAGIGVWPDYLFPLLWLSPLLIIASIQAIQGRSTIFSSIRHGNWRRIYLLAIAALICGFFWEMWNYLSFAKWIYAVPFVNRFKIFEMPILGYAGYLPFGLECAVIADIIGFRPQPET